MTTQTRGKAVRELARIVPFPARDAVVLVSKTRRCSQRLSSSPVSASWKKSRAIAAAVALGERGNGVMRSRASIGYAGRDSRRTGAVPGQLLPAPVGCRRLPNALRAQDPERATTEQAPYKARVNERRQESEADATATCHHGSPAERSWQTAAVSIECRSTPPRSGDAIGTTVPRLSRYQELRPAAMSANRR